MHVTGELLVCACAWLGCGAAGEDASDELTVGLLLPFTGSTSATASNFERAVLYAQGRVNAQGGIRGHKLRVVSSDTHSDLARSKEVAQTLIDQGARVILGPESIEVAEELGPLLSEQGVVLVSPLVGSASDPETNCAQPWFRLAPSATSLGEALAKLLSQQQVERVAVIYAQGAYNEALRAAVTRRFVELRGSVAFELEVDADAPTYADAVDSIAREDLPAVVLATSPRTGALLLNEYDASQAKKPTWILSPLLKTDLFTQNVAPDAVEGALGVTPRIFDDSDRFANAFGERWAGDQPLEGAYFYYDATAVVALALESASSGGRAPDVTSLAAAIRKVAMPFGEQIGWNDLERGLMRIGTGVEAYYAGLTGPLLLDRCGARSLGVSSVWTIHAGVIESAEAP